MAQTQFNGPLVAGDQQPGDPAGSNIGYVVLSQTALITYDADLVQEAVFYLPKNSQIVDILVDVLTAYNSATSATLTAGATSGGTEYAGSVNAKTAGRTRPTYTAAQLAAMDDIGTNTAVYVTVTSSGQPTAGQVRVTIQYVQTYGV